MKIRKPWLKRMEYLRLITPAGIAVMLWILGTINTGIERVDRRVESLDARVFLHFTNHELHVPKDSVVSEAEFKMHCQQNKTLEDRLIEIRNDIKELILRR